MARLRLVLISDDMPTRRGAEGTPPPARSSMVLQAIRDHDELEPPAPVRLVVATYLSTIGPTIATTYFGFDGSGRSDDPTIWTVIPGGIAKFIVRATKSSQNVTSRTPAQPSGAGRTTESERLALFKALDRFANKFYERMAEAKKHAGLM